MAGAEFLGNKLGAASEAGAFKPSVGDIALRDIGKLVVEDIDSPVPAGLLFLPSLSVLLIFLPLPDRRKDWLICRSRSAHVLRR